MPEAGVNRRFNVPIPLREGITLSADLVLPGALPAPAVVIRTPYGKTGERQSKRLTIFAEGGYAAVMVDVRGRGDSDGDVMAKLVDVHPDNFAQRLCDGMVRLRYRNGFDHEVPVTPGDVYQVQIAMWDTCVRLPAGHRLRVEIASSAFPKYDVNLGTGGDMISETEGVLATNRLWHTADRPSRLILG